MRFRSHIYEYCSVATGERERYESSVKLTWVDSIIRENDLRAMSEAQGTNVWGLPGGRQYGTSSSRRSLADEEEINEYTLLSGLRRGKRPEPTMYCGAETETDRVEGDGCGQSWSRPA